MFILKNTIIQKFIDTIVICIGRKQCGQSYIFDLHLPHMNIQ